MSIILNQWDHEFMKETVRDVINQWSTQLTILTPLPIDEQPNYNKLMHEYTGSVVYSKVVVPAERKDIVNNYTNNIQPDEVEYGKKNEGTLLYAIPDRIPVYVDGRLSEMRPFKPSNDSIFTIDDSGDQYYVRYIRDRIGETLVMIYRYTGGTDSGYKEDVTIAPDTEQIGG